MERKTQLTTNPVLNIQNTRLQLVHDNFDLFLCCAVWYYIWIEKGHSVVGAVISGIIVSELLNMTIITKGGSFHKW